MDKVKDRVKAAEAKMKEQELWESDAVYRFLTNQIDSTSFEIERKKTALKKLAAEQEALKRGRAALVELRRDLLSRKSKE